MSILSTLKETADTLLSYPKKRPDGVLVEKIHPYRRMLSFMMPNRNDAVVFYDDEIKADALLEYIERRKSSFPIDITHCIVAAAGIGFHENPKMNQFVVGKRLYARNHVAITFTAKRKKLNKEAKLAAIKLRLDKNESFESLCQRIDQSINVERSGKKTYSDKELDVLTQLPRPLLSGALSIASVLDYYNLLPADFIEKDAFYSSMVIANLGSLGMKAAFHHLYNYGTTPLFLMVGKIEERPVVMNGKVVPQKILPLRYSYDERIDDGFTSKFGMDSVKRALENPEKYFGPIKEKEEATISSDSTQAVAS